MEDFDNDAKNKKPVDKKGENKLDGKKMFDKGDAAKK